MSPQISINRSEVEKFCKKWKIKEFSLFGSVLRPDFRPDSDIDVLIAFQTNVTWSLWDQVEMEEELSTILDRKVDLVIRSAIERSKNWIRKESILNSSEPFYVS